MQREEEEGEGGENKGSEGAKEKETSCVPMLAAPADETAGERGLEDGKEGVCWLASDLHSPSVLRSLGGAPTGMTLPCQGPCSAQMMKTPRFNMLCIPALQGRRQRGAPSW